MPREWLFTITSPVRNLFMVSSTRGNPAKAWGFLAVGDCQPGPVYVALIHQESLEPSKSKGRWSVALLGKTLIPPDSSEVGAGEDVQTMFPGIIPDDPSLTSLSVWRESWHEGILILKEGSSDSKECISHRRTSSTKHDKDIWGGMFFYCVLFKWPNM